MKTLLTFTLSMLLFAAEVSLSLARDSIVPPDSELESLIGEAVAVNPSLEEARARLDAARAMAPQAGSWMDPRITFGALNLPADNPFKLDQEPMTGLWVNVAQTIPLNRIYVSRRDAAEAMAEAQLQTVALRRAAVKQAVREAWYDWAYLNSAAAAVDTTIQLVDDLLVLSRTRYETGRGLQSELLRLQTERSRLSSQQLQFEQGSRDAGRRVAVLLGREPGDVTPRPDRVPVAFPSLTVDELDSLAGHSPAIEAAVNRLRSQQARLAVAKRMWLPELTLGGGYGIRSDAANGMKRPDFISVTASVTLPVFGASKQSKAVEEARAEQSAAEDNLRSTQLDVRQKLESLVDEDQRQEAQIQLYDEGVLPQAQGALTSVQSAYSVGKVDVEALIGAERELINARLERIMHLRDRAKVRARIAALTDVQTDTDAGSQTPGEEE